MSLAYLEVLVLLFDWGTFLKYLLPILEKCRSTLYKAKNEYKWWIIFITIWLSMVSRKSMQRHMSKSELASFNTWIYYKTTLYSLLPLKHTEPLTCCTQPCNLHRKPQFCWQIKALNLYWQAQADQKNTYRMFQWPT